MKPEAHSHDQQGSDESALVSTLTANQENLRNYILRFVYDFEGAQDVLQETNSVIWKKRHEIAPDVPFIAFALKVAYFQCLSYIRDKGRSRLSFGEDIMEMLAKEPAHSPHEITDAEEALTSCLRRLKESDRKLILQRYTGESSVNEMAANQGITPNRLSQILRRIRIALRRCIENSQSPPLKS